MPARQPFTALCQLAAPQPSSPAAPTCTFTPPTATAPTRRPRSSSWLAALAWPPSPSPTTTPSAASPPRGRRPGKRRRNRGRRRDHRRIPRPRAAPARLLRPHGRRAVDGRAGQEYVAAGWSAFRRWSSDCGPAACPLTCGTCRRRRRRRRWAGGTWPRCWCSRGRSARCARRSRAGCTTAAGRRRRSCGCRSARPSPWCAARAALRPGPPAL